MLTIIYLIIVAIIGVFLVWNVFESKNIYDKVLGSIMLVLLILRLFLIK